MRFRLWSHIAIKQQSVAQRVCMNVLSCPWVLLMLRQFSSGPCMTLWDLYVDMEGVVLYIWTISFIFQSLWKSTSVTWIKCWVHRQHTIILALPRNEPLVSLACLGHIFLAHGLPSDPANSLSQIGLSQLTCPNSAVSSDWSSIGGASYPTVPRFLCRS